MQQKDYDALEASYYFHHLRFGDKLHFLCGQGEKGKGTTIARTVQQIHLRFDEDMCNKLAKMV